MHHKLVKIAEAIVCEVCEQVEKGLECVDTKELGEAIDMIKDLSKAIYYDVVTEAMLEVDELDSETVHKVKKTTHVPMVEHEWSSKELYADAKAKHADNAILMKHLEKYMTEIHEELAEIAEEATAEEKQYLDKKLSAIATKISSM